jgi:poly-gamma-glutamate synthesis protein (capsule biosynthesis protein)
MRSVALAALVGVVAFCTNKPEVTIALGGDVLFDRGIARFLRREHPDALFAGIRGMIGGADLFLVNLECPLTSSGERRPKRYSFRGDTLGAYCMAGGGVTHVSLANNHAFDCGTPGVTSTVRHINRAGIVTTGVDLTGFDPCAPVHTTLRGVPLAVLSANLIDAESAPDESCHICTPEPAALIDRVRTLHQGDPGLLIVVMVHWGIEYQRHPSARQVLLAHELIDAGARIVAGHHPHVLQRIETHHGGVIIYSLGNLVFDQRRPDCRNSMIVCVRAGAGNVRRIDIHPLLIDMPVPRTASPEEWYAPPISTGAIPIHIHHAKR